MDGICAKAGAHARELFLALLLPVALFGLGSNRSIDQFFHAAWTINLGAPSGITQLAQTAVGFLWLGTQSGLFRFDGVRFER